MSVEDVARCNPQALALVHKAQGKHQRNAGLVSGAPCHNCGKPGQGGLGVAARERGCRLIALLLGAKCRLLSCTHFQ